MNLILKQHLKYLISPKDSYTKYKYPDQKKSANIILQFPGDNPSLKNLAQKHKYELEAGTKAQRMKECCLWLALIIARLTCFSSTAHNHLSMSGTADSGPDPPTLIINQNVPHRLAFRPFQVLSQLRFRLPYVST